MVGEVEAGLVGVEEEGKAAVLFLDQVQVVGAAVHLEDGVPVGVVVDALVGGEEDVNYGQDLVGAFEERLGFLGEEGELSRPHQIAVLEELLRDPQETLRLGACCALHSDWKWKLGATHSFIRKGGIFLRFVFYYIASQLTFTFNS